MHTNTERYLELILFLRDPLNINLSSKRLNNILDELDELWHSFDSSDKEEIDNFIREIKIGL